MACLQAAGSALSLRMAIQPLHALTLWVPLKSCGHKAEISGLQPNSCGQRKGNPDRGLCEAFHSAVIGRKVCSERKPSLCIIQICQISKCAV